MTATAGAPPRNSLSPAVMLAVLGVVYGDIGTSPLYAMKASLAHFGEDGVDRGEVLGVLSLAFWSLLLIVTLKYIVIILRADNKGEGGILALMALAQRVAGTGRLRRTLTLVGIAGACLFFGDGIITPAISVLSAVEGLEIVNPALHRYVVPIAIGVIVALFAMQRFGTGGIGRVFGPVTALWFIALAALGLVQIVQHPQVLEAVLPHHAALLVLREPLAGFIALGSIVLAVTGAEALYADMGHFGRRPIRAAWIWCVLPALVLNYFGQGALILRDRAALENPFYLLAPGWLQLPLVILATAATVIASQAMISGAYSIARQCTQLGFAPRLVVRHTSETEEGQIYLPQVNWLLLLGVVVLVALFRNSEALAAAYGIAVTGTFLCTTLLAAVVFRRMFGWSRLAVVAVFGLFLVIDAAFFIANLLKVPEGGWVPLALGIALFVMMTTWRRGRDLLFARWQQDSMPLASFLARLPSSRTIRVPGIAVFMTGNAAFVPTALLHNLKHNKVLHERVLFVTVRNEDIPEVAPDARMSVETLAQDIYRVTLCYGFMESPNVPRELDALKTQGVAWEPMQASYFLGRETIVPAMVPKMPLWRHWLFLAMARNAVSATEFFRIPSDRVVELGVRIAI